MNIFGTLQLVFLQNTKTEIDIFCRSFCLDVGEDFHGRAPLLSTASPTDSKGGLTGSICSDEVQQYFLFLAQPNL